VPEVRLREQRCWAALTEWRAGLNAAHSVGPCWAFLRPTCIQRTASYPATVFTSPGL
jgi:hypothetical protein